MNTTYLTPPLTFIYNSSTANIESWLIPFDILMIVCTILVIIFAVLFLFIMAIDKTCHTVPLMLTANSCLTALMLSCTMLSLCIFTLENDLKQIQYQDSLCVFRGYMSYASPTLLYYSFLLQAIYRYITVIYPTRLFWQTPRSQALLIVITWIFGFLFPFAFIFTGDFTYNVDSQICQLPLRLSFQLIFSAFCIYGNPLWLTMFIYIKLVHYVKEISERVTPVNTLTRARRQLKMVRQTVILIMILFTCGFPYALFMLMSFFNRTPKYHYRIAFIFIDVSLVCVMIVLFHYTDPLKTSMKKIINRRLNIVMPTVT